MSKKRPAKKSQPRFTDREPIELKPAFEYDGFDEPSKAVARTPKANKPKPIMDPNPIKPGKDRILPQTQVNPEIKAKTSYQLVLSEEDHDKLHRYLAVGTYKLDFEPNVFQFLEEGHTVRDDWERFEKDIRKLSGSVKNILFRIECHGEDEDDIWVAFAHKGRFYYDDVEIIYPDFDFTRLI